MPESREPSGGLWGLLAVGMIACCGLPVLLGAGIAVGVTGLVLGSGVVVAAGVALGVWGWHRRQTAAHCEIGEPPHQPSDSMPDTGQVRPPR